MESVNVDDALKIIQNVDVTSDKVCVNGNQCKRLAERLDGIGKALEVLKTEDNENPLLETSAIDQILTVLKKGEALILSYEEGRTALQSFISGADNSEAFKEVHEELDALGTYLDLDNVDRSELRRSQTEKHKLLSSDARTDWEEMRPNLHHLIREVAPNASGRTVEQAEGDVMNMEMAITEKFYNAESNLDDLSYLNIPFSAIHTYGEIKELKKLSERKTQRDAHLDGKAIVLKGTWNGCDCAVKEFKSAEMHWNKEERHKEIASLVKLRHPHITQLIGCSENKGKTYVLYEKMDFDLRVLMDSRKKKRSWSLFGNRPFSRAEEVSIIKQIARGMFYLHKRKLVHGELKCTNVLVKEVGNNHIDVKVADFHCSRQLGQTPTGKYKPAHRPRWLPPEAFQHYNVNQPADELLMQGDVYSFAMTCCEVVTGEYPYDGVYGDDVEKKVIAGDRPKLPEDLSGNLKRLITKCWDAEPGKRPRFEEICYVLKVDAVNLSQVQKLFSCFGMATAAEPVADDRQEWTPLLRGLATVPPQQEIDNGAEELPHYLKIQPSDLEPGRPLGTGASAEVFEASWIGCKFAVKWLKVEHVIKLRQEVSIMMKLLHPHVIRLVGFAVLLNRCAIVMELMEMSLRELIDARSKQKPAIPFSESEALGIITKLALGMAFLHSRGVAHGDLKCANVLVRNTNTKGRLDVKIVDFGLSELVDKGSSKKPSVVGWWRAPEVILSMEAKKPVEIDSKAADVYSFAMMCYEVITGKKPFQAFSNNLAKALALGGGGPNLDNVNVCQDLKHLLKKCWCLEPQDRPKIDDVLNKLTAMSKCR